jgi:hypothetical protein
VRRRRRIAWEMLVVALLVLAPALGAQRPAAAAPHRGESITISVLTFGPGDLVFERFGHNALRVRDAATGKDLAYNWGMFSFDDPNFLGRFLSGDTRYWVDTIPTAWMIAGYGRQDRTIHEQELALTPAQRLDLATFVAENVKEENRYYRYDYFLDNCSTRLRDAIDRTLGGSLGRRFKPIRTEWTFRSESTRLTSPDGLAQAGMDIALGRPADEPITAWEAMFIPMRLRDYLREVTVATDGGTMPLVANERVLFTPERRAPEPMERRGLSIGGWGLILGAWMLLLAPFSATSRRRTRVPAAVMVGLWYALTGILGLALLGMWLGSPHVFWYHNLNLLLLSPLGVVAAVPVARAVLRGAFTRLSRGLMVAIAVMAMLTLLVAPFVTQRLGGPLLLLLPAHLGLAIAVWRHARAGSIVGQGA